MIKINLLPEELRKNKSSKKTFRLDASALKPQFLKIGFYLIAVLLGVHLFLGLSVLLKSKSLDRLNSRWQKLEPDKIKIDGINSRIVSLEKEVLPIKQLVDSRMMWAVELNKLSNLMTTGVWFTKLFVQTQIPDIQTGESIRVLNLEGCAASLYGDETALAARLVKVLQEDEVFFKYFSEIKLGPMERTTLEKNPVMNFKIFCFFRKEKAG